MAGVDVVGVDGVEAGIVAADLEALADLPSLGVRPRSRLMIRAAALASPLCLSRFGVGCAVVGVVGSLTGTSCFVGVDLDC